MRRQPKTDPAPIVNPNGWDISHGTYLSGRAHLDGVDALAAEMEAKWGCDRLRLLVTPELREKFDRQRYRLAAATRNGDLETLRQECLRMTTAWRTLDAAAQVAGAGTLAPEVLEVTLSDGVVAAIVRDNVEAHKIVAEGRNVVVYTLEEIGRLIDLAPGVLKAKLVFPGATVTAVRKSVPDPLDAIRHATDFDDPLDDLFQPSTN